MLAGVVVCTFGMLLLGFTRPFASIFTAKGSTAVRDILCFFSRSTLSIAPSFQNNVLTIWLAIIAIFCIDFSINAGEPLARI